MLVSNAPLAWSAPTDVNLNTPGIVSNIAGEAIEGDGFTFALDTASLPDGQYFVTFLFRSGPPVVLKDLMDIAAIVDNTKPEVLNGFTYFDKSYLAYSSNNIYKALPNYVSNAMPSNEDEEISHLIPIVDKNIVFVVFKSGLTKEFFQSMFSTAKTSDSEGFVNGVAYSSYRRYLYALSPQDNNIIKYERARDSFSRGSKWISEESINLSQAIDFDIDGSVYLLKTDGRVELFHRGKQVPLTVYGGQEGVLKDATKIFVKTNMTHVYFLNPGRNSVLVYAQENKGLQFVKEIAFPIDNKINDLHVDENETRLVVSDAYSLYEIVI